MIELQKQERNRCVVKTYAEIIGGEVYHRNIRRQKSDHIKARCGYEQ